MSTRYQAVQDLLRRESRTWLVSGVAGFIGSNLLEQLLRLEQKVVGIDNLSTGSRFNLNDVHELVGDRAWSRFRFIEGDITVEEDCRQACDGVEVVLHHAALGSVPRSIKNPRATHDANVTGFINILMAARDAGVRRIVYASSSSVYGDHPALPKVEDHVGKVLSPYAASKYANEIYSDAFSRCYGMSALGLRYFNVFGPRQDPQGAYAAVIPRWIGQQLRGEECQIYGDGETSRDFTYIQNVVQANLLAAMTPREPAAAVFNVACGESLTLNALFAAIQNAISTSNADFQTVAPKHLEFRQGDVRHSLADIARAQSLLGYAPTHFASQGLIETVKWYLNTSGGRGLVRNRKAS